MQHFLTLIWACRRRPLASAVGVLRASLRSVLRTAFGSLRPPHALTFAFILLTSYLVAQAPFFKMYDVSTLSNDRGWVLESDADGLTIATGSLCDDLHSCTKMYRLDYQGNIVWETLRNIYPYGMRLNSHDCLIRTHDGNLLASGDQFVEDSLGGDRYIWLMKIDINSGDSLWVKRYNSNASDYTRTIIELPNGDIIVNSEGLTPNDSTAWGHPNKSLLKTDSLGNIIWYHDYMDEWRGSLSGNMTVLSTGEILLSYLTYDWVTDDPYPTLTKLTADGEVMWSNRYYTSSWAREYVLATETSDGNYMMIANRDSSLNLPLTTGQDVVSIIDTSGNIISQNYIYLGAINGNFLLTCQPTPDGNVMALGSNYEMAGEFPTVNETTWLIKLAPTGAVIWERYLINVERDDYNDVFWGEDFKILPDGRIALSMTVDVAMPNGQNDSNAALMVLDSVGCFSPGCDTNLQWITTPIIAPPTLLGTTNLLVQPNPATATAVVQWQHPLTGYLTVTDLTGREVLHQPLQNATAHTLDCRAWPQGVYVLRVVGQDGHRYISKFIIQN